jgi:LysM domain
MSFLQDGKQNTAILALLMLFTAIGCATVTEQLEKTERWVTSLNKDGTEETVPSQAKQEGSPASSFYVHRVTWTGESLSIVAKWYTGNLENWKALANANPEIKPEFLQVGMKIRIPEVLMVNPDPMTQEFVASHYPKDTKRSKSPPITSADLPLIGPKSYSDK